MSPLSGMVCTWGRPTGTPWNSPGTFTASSPHLCATPVARCSRPRPFTPPLTQQACGDSRGHTRSLPPRSHVCGIDRRLRARRLTPWDRIPALPLASCVALGEADHLTSFSFPSLKGGQDPPLPPPTPIPGTASAAHLAGLHPPLQLLLLLLQRLHLGGRGSMAVTAAAAAHALTAARVLSRLSEPGNNDPEVGWSVSPPPHCLSRAKGPFRMPDRPGFWDLWMNIPEPHLP